ncbi:MAG TPA: helix-turn-helix domain-containing protein [Azospirillum sp.]|nr:helix-turn-helix domain-containing protein [Azospirillum sp.]
MILRTLLIADDESALGRTLCDGLRSWRIVVAIDRASARAAVKAHRPTVALVPLDPGGEGTATLGAILAEAPACKVVMLDGGNDRAAAARAVALGAHDVVLRAAEPAELTVVIERAHHRHALEQEGRRLTGDAPPTLRAVRDAAERRAVLDALARVDGNLSAAARLLEVSRPTLYNLLRQHGIRTA